MHCINHEGWLLSARCVPSPNFDDRPHLKMPPNLGAQSPLIAVMPVELIVIHNISLPPAVFGTRAVEAFFCNQLKAAHFKSDPFFAQIATMRVSSHFYIRRGGRVIQFVSTDKRAWHAGESTWQGRSRCNDFSIGIELEGTDTIPYTPAQYHSLRRVIRALCRRYPIQAIAGHCHIAPHRKTDPGPSFNWLELAQQAAKLGLALP